jgi:hypothetical protein
MLESAQSGTEYGRTEHGVGTAKLMVGGGECGVREYVVRSTERRARKMAKRQAVFVNRVASGGGAPLRGSGYLVGSAYPGLRCVAGLFIARRFAAGLEGDRRISHCQARGA